MTGMPPGPEMAKPSAAQLSPVLQPSSPARLLISTAPNASRLTFDDVAKHFNVPIAEAATALGVCSSVLKRICRENGVVRWPYRKFLAGKTVDDIKKDAAKEKSKEFAELSKCCSVVF
ncbi:unnamed protein product [Spirodela intermedia]|uniref:RWP-RK domain-containing protein n=1 Tax=Spirodela intermedia TaxID=51605 RepID=A0A7I8J5P3_SPIIN|nr:unnamed protein product [Spirodela intermedia]CAA6665411.1 unnamed protein product [Spirodela intermedia]